MPHKLVILDSSWEAEFCRVAESHPRSRHMSKIITSLGSTIPLWLRDSHLLARFHSLSDDGHDDPLHLIVEIKVTQRDAKDKKSLWKPTGARHQHYGKFGRWTFAEFTEIYQIEADFEAKVESEFGKMIEVVSEQPIA